MHQTEAKKNGTSEEMPFFVVPASVLIPSEASSCFPEQPQVFQCGCSGSCARMDLRCAATLVAESQVVPVAADTSLGSLQLHNRHADVFKFREYVRIDEERLHGEGAVPGTSVQKYLAVPPTCFLGLSRWEPGVFQLRWRSEEAEPPAADPLYLYLI